MSTIRPFHLAIPVSDLAQARSFYGETELNATHIRLGTRVDKESSMDAKLRSVEEKLDR